MAPEVEGSSQHLQQAATGPYPVIIIIIDFKTLFPFIVVFVIIYFLLLFCRAYLEIGLRAVKLARN
jgi:hypothetical protein